MTEKLISALITVFSVVMIVITSAILLVLEPTTYCVNKIVTAVKHTLGGAGKHK